jgi:transposase-like protein
MAPRANHKRLNREGQALIQELLQERLKLSIQYTFITVPEKEVEAFLNAALYQSTPDRRGRRNGHYERDLLTTLGLIEDMPCRGPGMGFAPSCSSVASGDRQK